MSFNYNANDTEQRELEYLEEEGIYEVVAVRYHTGFAKSGADSLTIGWEVRTDIRQNEVGKRMGIDSYYSSVSWRLNKLLKATGYKGESLDGEGLKPVGGFVMGKTVMIEVKKDDNGYLKVTEMKASDKPLNYQPIIDGFIPRKVKKETTESAPNPFSSTDTIIPNTNTAYTNNNQQGNMGGGFGETAAPFVNNTNNPVPPDAPIPEDDYPF